MQDDKEGVFASSGNMFADLSLPDAEAQMAKAQLAHAIRNRIREFGLNQSQAADRLGATQARVSEIMNGKVGKMSYELRLDYLNALDCDVQITVIPRPQVKPSLTSKEIIHDRGHILVASF